MNQPINKKRQLLSITLTCIVCWIFTYLATNIFRRYSLGLFVWLPFVSGALCTLLYAYKNPVGRIKLRNNAFLTLLVFCLGLLVFAWEGVICLIMATPIGFVFTYLGFLAGAFLSTIKTGCHTPTTIILFALSVPALMAFENSLSPIDAWRQVTTSIEIDATPEKVWKNVISFPRLKDPTGFIFKTGIAYPIDATIDGTGVGAVRHCNFSTGSFVEPITTWDEPRVLQFSVAEQPEPLKEISFYDIHPNHLHGYWVSKQGQFELIPLPNGHTLLRGTTWYINKIAPGIYWTLWSDYIVHKIHTRVLEHIKTQTEAKAGTDTKTESLRSRYVTNTESVQRERLDYFHQVGL